MRASLQGRPNQDLSLVSRFSRSAVKIPVKAYRQPGANLDRENDNTQTRQLDNYFLKAFYHAHDDLSLEASILYAQVLIGIIWSVGSIPDERKKLVARALTWRLTGIHRLVY